MCDFNTTFAESKSGFKESEIFLPPRCPPDTILGPSRNTFHCPITSTETTFTENDSYESRSSERQPPDSTEATLIHDDLPERSLSASLRDALKDSYSSNFGHAEIVGTRGFRPQSFDSFGSEFSLPDELIRPFRNEDRQFDPQLFDSSGSEFSLSAELIRPFRDEDDQDEPLIKKNSDVLDDSVATVNRPLCDLHVGKSESFSSAHKSASNSDPSAIAPDEHVSSLHHNTPVVDSPNKCGSIHFVDVFGTLASNDAKSENRDQYDFEILEDHEDGKAYEDDEAWCGKCGGVWWADEDNYKTFWGLKEGEFERWRCSRCGKIRIRKKNETMREIASAGSAESCTTAADVSNAHQTARTQMPTSVEEIVHPLKLDDDNEEENREADEKKKSYYVPGGWIDT
ncbi:hypothetical protein FKW77_007169 [Venturia effusa]|uniref:Uncharacterized protein n=1 Tax=Venturia effusa TaxID=50376 RepID=A0A517LB33_9PEZI|nr:hypothetical protein FKW77_007169 [Venturia effusa]